MLTSYILGVIILNINTRLSFSLTEKQHHLPTNRAKFGQPYSVSRIFNAKMANVLYD